MTFNTDIEYAKKLDSLDQLAKFKDEFVIDDPDLIYLDGNSLGRLPKRTKNRLQYIIENEWGKNLIRSWNDSWFALAERVGKKIAKLVDSDKNEVIVADSTSVNLFKLAFAALRFNTNRTKIITDNLNFPSDIYILESVTKLFGQNYELRIVKSSDGITIPISELAREIDNKTALVGLSHTAFKSGFVYDIAEVTNLVHEAGALMLWDLSHSIGAVDFSLKRTNVDLAIGCTYKYVNSGPGAPAFLFVKEELQNKLENPIAGWFGQERQFNFDLIYKPVKGIRRFLTGTPPILSLAAIEDGVDLLLEAGIRNLRKKSIQQTEYFIFLWETFLKPLGFRLNSPFDSNQRGSHVSIGHNEGNRINKALIEEKNVIPDFRQPDNIRFGFAPIYTSFSDIYHAVLRLKEVVTDRIYEKYSFEIENVT